MDGVVWTQPAPVSFYTLQEVVTIVLPFEVFPTKIKIFDR